MRDDFKTQLRGLSLKLFESLSTEEFSKDSTCCTPKRALQLPRSTPKTIVEIVTAIKKFFDISKKIVAS